MSQLSHRDLNTCVRFWWRFIARQLLHPDGSKWVFALRAERPGGGSPADRTGEGDAARCTEAGKQRWLNQADWCDAAQMEEEIQTLRQVLLVKEKDATDIRKQLGLGPFSHFKQNLSKGWHDVQSSAPWVPCLLVTFWIFIVGDVTAASPFNGVTETITCALLPGTCQPPPLWTTSATPTCEPSHLLCIFWRESYPPPPVTC